MIRLNCDYCKGALPEVLEALQTINDQAFCGYGCDEVCERAARLIRERAGVPSADVHFLVGGTQANFVVIESALRPWQSVICADSGHINVHETGAVEATGHKVLPLPSTPDGKITAEQVENAYLAQTIADGEQTYAADPLTCDWDSLIEELGAPSISSATIYDVTHEAAFDYYGNEIDLDTAVQRIEENLGLYFSEQQ